MAARCWFLVLFLLLGPAPVWGCSIPVFRFALERWQPAAYQAVVFHRGVLQQETRAALIRLEEHRSDTNLIVTTVDLDGKVEAESLKLWEKQGPNAPLPWLVVRFPEAEDKTPLLWTGSPTTGAFDALLDSPGRRHIVKHLSSGASAVFVLLAGEDEAGNEATAMLLERELKRQQETIELPEQSSDGPQLLSHLPLRVSFPVLRLSRRQATDQLLVQMLLRGEDDLTAVKGPIVFPVFGRGRMLCSLHGEDLTSERIAEAARFLCGACSCRVKELNPGVDLLIAAAWTTILDAKEPPGKEVVPTPRLPERPAPLPVSEAAPAKAATGSLASPAPESRDRNWLWLLIAGAGVLVLLTGGWVLRSRDGSTSPT